MRHIGLVLSGGMAKGAYQLGSLMALKKYILPSDFECVSAASIGVLNAYTYLTDNLETAGNIWTAVDFKGEQRFVTSILRSDFLQYAVSDIITQNDIKAPFFIPLLNLADKELVYYNLAEVPKDETEAYLKASIAMPFYNKGIAVGDKCLYDGAVVDNIPVYPVLKHELDYVIVIYFDNCNYVFEDRLVDDKIIKLTFPDNKIISNSIQVKHDSIMYMIREGYNRTNQILSYIFSEGIDNLPAIYSKIKILNTENLMKKPRITGDVVVTNMNKLVKKFVRHDRIIDGGIKIETKT